jgi:multicomponent Na+:H+ antiporter subunit G
VSVLASANAWAWIKGALLVAGVGVQVICLLGLLVARDVFDRLHLVAPASVFGAALVCASIVVSEIFSQAGIKAIIVGSLLLLSGPVLTHATARAVRLRETGNLLALPSETRRAEEQ